MTDAPRDERPWLRLREVARLLSVSPKTLQRRIKSGRIKAVQVANAWAVTREELERVIASVKAGEAL